MGSASTVRGSYIPGHETPEAKKLCSRESISGLAGAAKLLLFNVVTRCLEQQKRSLCKPPHL